MIRFGPAGIGGVKEAAENLEKFSKLGLKACEIPFTYGVFIKKDKHQKEIKEIRETAEKLDIKLSIHAPYWINLNSKEKKKIEESKKRILDSCEVGEMLGVKYVVFHPGYYSDMSEEETYENIKNTMLDIQKTIKEKKWKIQIAPETTGKVNVFGKEEEILKLVKDTKCYFCIDFSHLFARNQGKMSYKEMYEKVKDFKTLHCHFSGIDWGNKGERNHKSASDEEIKKLLEILPKNKDITIISESKPNPLSDAIRYLEIWKKL